MAVGLLSIHLALPECQSLKQKRSRLQPILTRLHREFNIAAAEVSMQDRHKEAGLQCAVISTKCGEAQAFLQRVVDFISSTWPDSEILEYRIECI
jgi:uncharacterized protein YlxP (DUF503 family)